MLPIRPLLTLLACLWTCSAFAQSATEYTLEEKIIKFKAPSDWTMIMQKAEGNPQFVAFQVKDPADAGTGETTQVTVETKLLDDSSNFQSLVNLGMEKTRQMPGYEQKIEGVDPNTLRYFALNGKTRYEFRETYYLLSHLFIHVKCARPMLAGTTAAWTESYEKGCALVMQTIRPH
ncbi:MAG TPA: hypothetical protein VF132_05325 [Rudaea sp.]